MIRFLPTVRVVHFGPELAEVLQCASLWALVARVDVDVNSIDDLTHGASTLHGASLAIDLDPVTDRADHTRALGVFLGQRLSDMWDVLIEADHVHCEYDTQRRFPPPPTT